jgi:hypothetical protein
MHVCQQLEDDSVQTHFCKDDPLVRPFDEEEVSQVIIKHLPNGKAGRTDEIVNGEIALINVVLKLNCLINADQESGILPVNRTIGRFGPVISTLKGEKRNKMDRDSYRGITLLNVIGKVF